MVLNTALILWTGYKVQEFGKIYGRRKSGPFRTQYKEKIPYAFRVYCFAVVLKKTNTSPVKDANCSIPKEILNKLNFSFRSRPYVRNLTSFVPTYHAIKILDEWR
jgi:hypothetical protein